MRLSMPAASRSTMSVNTASVSIVVHHPGHLQQHEPVQRRPELQRRVERVLAVQSVGRQHRDDRAAAARVAAVYSGSSPPSGIRVNAEYGPGWWWA